MSRPEWLLLLLLLSAGCQQYSMASYILKLQSVGCSSNAVCKLAVQIKLDITLLIAIADWVKKRLYTVPVQNNVWHSSEVVSTVVPLQESPRFDPQGHLSCWSLHAWIFSGFLVISQRQVRWVRWLL